MRHRRFLHPCLPVLAALALSSCMSAPLDLPKALEVTDVSSGYFDAGIVDGGKNKIVPAISFRLKNRSNAPVVSIQMIARFNVIGDTEELGSAPFVRAIGPDGLAPGRTGNAVVMKSNIGYTGEQPRATLFSHSQFKDVKVVLWGKYEAQQYQKMGEYTISRQLLTR